VDVGIEANRDTQRFTQCGWLPPMERFGVMKPPLSELCVRFERQGRLPETSQDAASVSLTTFEMEEPNGRQKVFAAPGSRVGRPARKPLIDWLFQS
jgi:hypothetical protein